MEPVQEVTVNELPKTDEIRVVYNQIIAGIWHRVHHDTPAITVENDKTPGGGGFVVTFPVVGKYGKYAKLEDAIEVAFGVGHEIFNSCNVKVQVCVNAEEWIE